MQYHLRRAFHPDSASPFGEPRLPHGGGCHGQVVIPELLADMLRTKQANRVIAGGLLYFAISRS